MKPSASSGHDEEGAIDPPESCYDEATDKNSDADFLCDEEDEEDDSEKLKKSFNLSFIFTLFKAAMDGKMGEKNGNSSPRLSKGPRDSVSDYVMLVLNQNQKENEEICILIDGLRKNGVNCFFFTSNDIRNGTIKPPSEIPEVNKAKQLEIRNPQVSFEQSRLDNNNPISPPEVDRFSSLAHKVNGITPNEIHTLSIPANPNTDKRSLSSNAYNHQPNKRIKISSLSPLPPLLSPQMQLSDNQKSYTDESLLTNSYSQEDDSSVLVTTPLKEPAVVKKRRRKRRYPYGNRKPAKKRNVWKIIPNETSLTQTTQSDDNDGRVEDPVVRTVTPDPYAFIPDEIEAHVIERPYTPKKCRVNGLTKDCTDNVVKVNGEISKDVVQEVNVLFNSPEKVISDPRAFSPDIVTETTDTRFRPHTTASKKRKKRSSHKSKVQRKPKTCVQSISDDNEVRIIDELLPSDVSVHGSSATSTTQDNLKHEVLEIPDLAVPSGPQDEVNEIVNTTCPTEASSEDVLVTLVKDSTNSAQAFQGQVKIKKEVDVVAKGSLQRKPKDGEGTPPTSEASFMEAMQLRRPSFYSQIAGNVRNNMENHLDGRMTEVKAPKRRKRARNGFLLHHGDNFPEDPEAPYKLHLATQILLKLNKRRSKFKPKEDKGKTLLSYLKLVPKRSSRAGKSLTNLQPPEEPLNVPDGPTSVFSGEWTQERMFVCNVCGHVEDYFWNMVTHKGEIHPGIVVTHVELPEMPPVGFRFPPKQLDTSALPPPPPCTKCSATYSNYPDLHRHIFECAGNASWLEEKKPEKPPRKKPKKKRGFKRRLSNTPKKVYPKKTDTPKRRNSEVFKCEFCAREFKSEGWLKNHLVTHSLKISIPLDKLTLPPRAFISSRRSCVQSIVAKA